MARLTGLGVVAAIGLLASACLEPVEEVDPEHAAAVVATAVAAQAVDEQLAEETAAALEEHERAWHHVEVGPQDYLRVMIASADVRNGIGFPEEAKRIKDDAHPLVVDARSAALEYEELARRSAKASVAAVAALEAVEAAGAWDLYEEMSPVNLAE